MSEPILEQAITQVLDPVDINGRLSELQELNAALSGRCAGLRGQLAMKDQELARLRQRLAVYEAEEAARKVDEPPKSNGSKHKEAAH